MENAKFAIGPSIKNGFYYDIDFEGAQIALEDLEKIESEMNKIVKEDLPIIREEISRKEAIEFLKSTAICIKSKYCRN